MIHLLHSIYSYSMQDRTPPLQATPAVRSAYYDSSLSSCEKPSLVRRGLDKVQSFFSTIKKGIKYAFFYSADGLQIFFYFLKNKLLCIRVPNFHKVGKMIYRGGQPTKRGFSFLEKMGIRTVISLREEKSDELLLEGKKLNYAHFSFSSEHPSIREVVDFLRIIKNPDMQPVFIHCFFGADRTGIACALYRIFEENWTKERAIKEMLKGGFGFHYCYRHFVDFIQGLNIQKIREQLYSIT